MHMDIQLWFICLYSKKLVSYKTGSINFSDIAPLSSSSSFYSGEHTLEIITTIMVQRQLENYHRLSASTAVIDLEAECTTTHTCAHTHAHTQDFCLKKTQLYRRAIHFLHIP